jgi:stage II sporulation protein D
MKNRSGNTGNKGAMSVLLTVLLLVVCASFTLSGPRSGLPGKKTVVLPPLEELLPAAMRADDYVMLSVLIGNDDADMSLERFLLGAVAAEMPASFEPEALKAQAVTARTNVLYNMLVAPKSRHPGVDVCDDYTCCMAYSTDERLRQKWGEDYTEYMPRIISAVIETDGEVLTYDSKPILSVFHSSSAAKTESSGNVWFEDLPYLQSVSSPETGETVPDYVSTIVISQQAFIDTFTAKYPDALFDSHVDSWVTEITHTASGRVDDLKLGGVKIRGTQLRSLFGLRSTAVSIRLTANDVIFTTTGYGHGVGMSQYGANTMAGAGAEYGEILLAYYTGCVLTQSSVLQDIVPTRS